jgi:hypothetical protein
MRKNNYACLKRGRRQHEEPTVLRDRDTRNNNDAIESFNSNSFIKLGDLLALYFSDL